jgi:ribose 5-phosphate isomerase B
MRVAIAADHNGVDLKARLTTWLAEHGHVVDDRGSHGHDVVDYPALCADVGRLVASGDADTGLVLGGSGQGEVIACNKIKGVRAGLCHTEFATQISRGHNDANVMVVGAKVVDAELAQQLLALWFETPFKGGRHQARVDQITALEN